MIFKNKVVKNIIYYGIGDFVVTGVTAFLFIPLYIKYLSVNDYGIFNILNNNATLFTYIYQFGIISAFGRIYYLRKSEKREKGYIWNIIIFHILLSLALFLLIYIFKKPIFNNLSPSIEDGKLLIYPIALAFLTFLPALYYIYLRVEEKVVLFVRYQLLNVLLITTLLLSNIFFYKIDIYIVLICFIITNVVLWGIVALRFISIFSIDFNVDDIKETIKFSFPIFISYIAYFFISKYSIVILQKHVPLKEIGTFALAQQIAAIPSLITIAISKAIQPYLFSSNSNDELANKVKQIDRNYKLIMIWIVGVMIFSVDIVFGYFLPASYYNIRDVAKYLLLATLIYNFSIVENSVLLYHMKSKTILLITVTGSVLNVVLSNLFVYKYSIKGIVAAMIISFSINFILDIIYSSKHVKFHYRIKPIAISLALVFLFLVLSTTDLFPIYYSHKITFASVAIVMLTSAVFLLLKKSNYEFIKKTSHKV